MWLYLLKKYFPFVIVLDLSATSLKQLSSARLQSFSNDLDTLIRQSHYGLPDKNFLASTFPNGNASNKKLVFRKLFEEVEKAKQTDNPKELFRNYVRLGLSYYENNDYVSSLKYYNLAIRDYKGKQSDTNFINALIKTGTINGEMGNNNLALKVFKQAIEILEVSEDKTHPISYKYFSLLANELYRLNEIDKAEEQYQKSLKYSTLFSDSILIGKSFFGLSRIETRKNNFAEALRLGKRSLAILKSNKADKRTLMICALNLSHIYIHLKQYDNAFEKASRVYAEAKLINDLKILMDAAFHLKMISYEKQDYASAFNYQEIYSYLKDSLFSLNKKLELFTQSLNYEFEQKSRQDSIRHTSEHQKLENEIRFKEIKQRSNNTIFFAVGIGVVAVLLFYFYALKQNRQQQKTEYERKLSEAKITALIAQINPHFVFNSLNSILSFIQNSNKEEAIKYLSKFSKIVRLILEGCNQQTVTVNDEIQLLRLYVELEQLRNDHMFDFTLEVGPEIDTFNTEIPVMMLQPFIENAILHGIQNKIHLSKEIKVTYRGLLSIKYSQQNDKIICSIKDNGVGRKKSRELFQESTFRYKSTSLEFTEKRLELLTMNSCSIRYIDLYDDHTQEPMGTEVIIELPVMN